MQRVNLYDKTDWSNGPWKEEFDCIRWIDKETNLACMIFRSEEFGTWAGFVGVTPDHPLYRIPKTEESYKYIDVHNGIHFSGYSASTDVFFMPPIKRWWIGFYCNGDQDLIPNNPLPIGEYRNEDYVLLETSVLAEQLEKMYVR